MEECMPAVTQWGLWSERVSIHIEAVLLEDLMSWHAMEDSSGTFGFINKGNDYLQSYHRKLYGLSNIKHYIFFGGTFCSRVELLGCT